MTNTTLATGRRQAPLLFALLLAFCFCVLVDVRGQSPSSETPIQYVHHGAGNPYLPLWEHLPDGEPRVFEDPDNPGHYRIYIIGSHDVSFRGYCGPDIRAWSAPVEDLASWRDEGPIFTHQVRGRWDTMFAPDLVEVKRPDGKKEYYLYPHSRGRNREAMVAKGNRPDGPFTPINLTEDRSRTVRGSTMGFDPAVYIETITKRDDPDYEIGFRAFGYWGFQRSTAGQLDQNTMYSLRPGTTAIDRFIPAGSRYGVVRDPQGTEYPHVYPDQDLGAFNFFEAASIRKIGNKYVWVYSGYSGPDYGLSSTNSALRYAYGDSPLGPWRSGGVLVDSRAVVPSKDAFKINVWLDGPWDNETWQGKKIGVISVPANAAQEVTQFAIDVASSVDDLGEKHAIFLVADGPESQALCDIVGLGFNSAEKEIVRPVPPSVSIQVNGEEIELPTTPVRSTPANGITGYGQYEATYALSPSDEGAPKVTASASDPEVKVDITPAESRNGATVVKFDNNGVVKTYRVVFTSE